MRIVPQNADVTGRLGYDETIGRPQVEFQAVLRDSILEGMTNVLGETGMRAVLFHLESSQQPWDSPEQFHDNLCAIFKDGAAVLEKIMVKELFQRCGLTYPPTKDFDFQRYVDLAREMVVTRMARMGRYDYWR